MARKTLPKPIIRLFFTLGLMSAVSIRLIMIFNRFDKNIARGLWYFGVIGYVFFFGYRFYIAKLRRKTILDHHLIDKVNGITCLGNEDKEQLNYVLSSIVKSKEIYNYIFIFILSIIAIVLDIVLEIVM